MKRFRHFYQYDSADCGPTCLRMVANHYGKSFTPKFLRDISGIDRQGVNMGGDSESSRRNWVQGNGSESALYSR